MLTRIFIFISVFILTGCFPSTKTIEVGDYLFEVPGDFNLIEGQGIDSYVGKIKNDSVTLYFDFGYYSDDFGKSAEEYLKDNTWKDQMENLIRLNDVSRYMKRSTLVDVLNIRKTTVADSVFKNNPDYIAQCVLENDTFLFPIVLPDRIRLQEIKTDTLDSIYRKISYSKYPLKGFTGIYLRKLNGFNPTFNNYKALSMTAKQLNHSQQELVLKIFRSGRLK